MHHILSLFIQTRYKSFDGFQYIAYIESVQELVWEEFFKFKSFRLIPFVKWDSKHVVRVFRVPLKCRLVQKEIDERGYVEVGFGRGVPLYSSEIKSMIWNLEKEKRRNEKLC